MDTKRPMQKIPIFNLLDINNDIIINIMNKLQWIHSRLIYFDQALDYSKS